MSIPIQTNGERTAYWDNLKYFLITLVVLGHFLDAGGFSGSFWPRYLFGVIYSFHMPLFLFVSGIFSKGVINGKQLRIERVISFLLLYVLYKTIRTLLTNGLFGLHRDFNYFIASDLSWYLLTMACLLVLTYSFRKVRPVCLLLFALLCGIAIGCDDSVGDIFSLARSFVYWPFFLLGYYLEEEKVRGLFARKWVRVGGCLAFALFLWMAFSHWHFFNGIIPMFSGHNGAETIQKGYPGYQAWMRLPYYGTVCLIGAAFMSLIPHRRLPFITGAGGRTLAVFFLHNMILRESGFVTWLQRVLPGEKEYMAVVVVCAIVWTAMLSLKPFYVPFRWIMQQKYEWLLGRKGAVKKVP